MSWQTRRLAWTLALGLAPYLIATFVLLDPNFADWPQVVRFVVGLSGAFLAIAAFTFPHRLFGDAS